MSQRLPALEPSGLPMAMAIGSIVGVLATTAYHLLHDQVQYASAELLRHFLPQLVAFGIGGAILFAVGAVVLNRRKRERSFEVRNHPPGLRDASPPLSRRVPKLSQTSPQSIDDPGEVLHAAGLKPQQIGGRRLVA